MTTKTVLAANEMLLANEVVTVSKEAQQVINLLNGAVSQIKSGVTFFGMRNYTKKENGEVSNYLINLGMDYSKQKEKDIEVLRNLDLTKGTWQSDLVTLEIARTALIESFINPDKNRSEGQINAFTNVCKGLKVHNENATLHIYGYLVKKTVITESTQSKKVVKSAALTIAKNELRKLLTTGKFVSFVVTVGNTIAVSGEQLEINL